MDDRVQYVRRQIGEAYRPDCVKTKVKHPTSVMVWSCMSYYGVGRLYIVNGTMNQVQYTRVLETKLLPQLQEWFSEGTATFMQDGAQCHTAKSVMRFLACQGSCFAMARKFSGHEPN